MKRRLCALFVAAFVFSSCAVLDRTPTIYYNEEELSLGDITEMRHSFEKSEIEKETVELVPYDGEPGDGLVYWIESGQVWHLSYKCRHLSSESKVIYGSEENAVECGKSRACMTCSKTNDK